MRNRLLAKALLFFWIVFPAGAVVLDNPESFFYDAGYRKGYSIGRKQGYVEGYRRALEDVKKILRAYEVDVRALESGKYLYKEGLVTYPRVYRVKEKEGYRIVVKGCRIEDVRSLDEIFGKKGLEIPVLDLSLLVEGRKAQERLIRFPELSKRIEEETRVPPKPIFVQVSPSATSLLERYNVPYTVEETATGKRVVRAVFFDEKEAKEFCSRNNGVCGEGKGGEDELEER